MFFHIPKSYAQFEDAGEITRSGIADANLLLENYLKPFGSGFGATMNTGWVNSARPHRPLGFDLRISVATAIVPESDRIFDIAQLNLTHTEVAEGQATTTPTAFGEDTPGPDLQSKETINGERLFEFQMPQGIGYPYVPTPMAQLTVGIIKDTDISIRFLPNVEVSDDINIQLWGFGAKHRINQWLPDGSRPPFDLSVQFGYSSLKSFMSYDVQPIIDSRTHVPEGYERGAPRWDDQGAELESSTFTSNLLIGKKFVILSLFGGVGLQHSTVKLISPGSYPIIEPNTDERGNFNDPSTPKRISSIEDPLNLNLSAGSGMRALAGFRIQLGFLGINATYIHSRYPVANIGVGISFR